MELSFVGTDLLGVSEDVRSIVKAELDNAFRMRDELLAVLAHQWESHLVSRMSDDKADWATLLCIHSPEGPLVYHLADERLQLFDGLPLRESHWDGALGTERSQRLARLARTRRHP